MASLDVGEAPLTPTSESKSEVADATIEAAQRSGKESEEKGGDEKIEKENTSAIPELSPHVRVETTADGTKELFLAGISKASIHFNDDGAQISIGNSRFPPPPPPPPPGLHGLPGLPSSVVSTEPPRERTFLEKVVHLYENRGVTGEVLSTRAGDDPDSPENQELPVMELVTAYCNGMELEFKELRIRSPMLINALRSVVKYSDENLDSDTVMFLSPYKLLYFHEEELRAFKDNHPPTHDEKYRIDCNRHLDVLLKFLDDQERQGGGLLIEKARWRTSIPTVTFRNLWLLMKPGDVALVRMDDNTLQPYVFRSVSGGISKGVPKPYNIDLWNMDCGGANFGRSRYHEVMRPFDGEIEITKLSVFPARFYKDWESMREKFIARGKKFFKLTRDISFGEYTGSPLQGEQRRYDRARIVIDYRSEPWTYDKWPKDWHEPHLGNVLPELSSRATCYCKSCQDAESDKTQITRVTPKYEGWDFIPVKEAANLSDEQYMLFSRYLFGHVLKDRGVYVLDVDNVCDPVFDTTIMNRIVMDNNKKKIIQAICKEYSMTEDWTSKHSADLIAGKGQGKIFLLHGSPGVGKTLTAECVAEFTRRPLLSITAGDIGITADSVQKELSKYFDWAERWRAVLLLDEADIYLERRGRNDLERNSVVSVFLRELEYYRGILFITTNRVGWFDEAFKSRIHMSIYYKPFDASMRETIWNNHFERIMQERKGKFDIGWNVLHYIKHDEDLLSMNLNGREIRNAFQTAVTLAEYEAQDSAPDQPTVLKKEHLEEVIKMSKQFESYLQETHKADDAFLAKASGYRADDFDEEMVSRVVAKSLKELSARKDR